MKSSIILTFTFGLIYQISCLYDSNDDVIELNNGNFNNKIIGCDGVCFVEFYAPWCGHCQSLAPDYKKFASAFKGIIQVGALDSDVENNKDLASQYNIRGFPTIKIFRSDIKEPIDYSGPRTSQGLIDESFRQLKDLVNSRLGGKSKSRSKKSDGAESDETNVVTLTDANFADKIFNDQSGDFWLVEFYAPWCGHCKQLAPEWASAANTLKGKAVKLAALDATQHPLIAGKYKVQGYPTIKMFVPTRPGVEVEPQDYDGGRRAADIVTWVNDKLADNQPAPEVKQIINEELLKAACDKNKLCIISFLPNILDCQSQCRNAYIDTLTQLGGEFKKSMLGWLWTEAGQQPEIERALDIGGFGYPAMAAVNTKKKIYTVLRGPFSEAGIREFVRDINYGKAGTSAPVREKEFSDIKKLSPWDGQDGKLELEEEIDLSDVKIEGDAILPKKTEKVEL
ncbi:unnamed protein product [Gordionus sp. m RMFG-2023]|uniref:protein disulfide-isomerase A6 homolog isoform X2 n=1 Tax=Gordionus sp. m RMFG-2023 TaxID=3053472 RepID=UPI0030E41B6E